MDNIYIYMTKWVIFEMVIKMISIWVMYIYIYYIYTIIEYASWEIKMKYDEMNMIELVLLWFLWDFNWFYGDFSAVT